MARAYAQDFLHSMRFHANVIGVGGQPRLNTPQAGFSACSTPEQTVEAVEYREGQYVYSRKYPGIASMSDITLSRGVARKDGSFYAWMVDCAQGGAEYRADIDIRHYHREAMTGSPTGIDLNLNPARIYHVHEAFPIRHKAAADLDATASEISITELDVACEFFTVEEV